MIRQILGAALTCFFAFQSVDAQVAPKLTIPASPAFSILNYEPAAVMRPTNAKELAADVLNSFDKDGKLLLNLGLEVTPYWLKSHPKLDRNTYLNPNPGQAFLQSFSLSAATVKDSVSGNNKLGAGFRFKLFNGHPIEELASASAEQLAQNTILDAINAVRATLDGSDTKTTAIAAIVKNLNENFINDELVAIVKKQAETLATNYGDSAADINRFLVQLISDRAAAGIELSKRVSGLLYERRGFILEFAGATGLNTSVNNLERIGFWGNASYYISPDDLFTLTVRYMNQNNDTALSNFDAGLGFLKKNGNYNISVEAMFRWYRAGIPDRNSNNQPITRLDKDFTYRLAVQSSYMISKDVSINLSLGKDFDSPFISGSGFFSIIGLNFSIFSKEPAKL